MEDLIFVIAEMVTLLLGCYMMFYGLLKLMGDVVYWKINDIPVENEQQKTQRYMFILIFAVLLLCLSFTFSGIHNFEKPYDLPEIIRNI